MQQQTRNASMWADEEGIDLRFLILDRDTKFTDAFDEHFRGHRRGSVLTPYGAPIANCFAESWIRSLARQCLNLLFCFSLRLLDHVVQTYVDYHNKFRPQALGNRPIGTTDDPGPQSPDAGLGGRGHPLTLRCPSIAASALIWRAGPDSIP